MESENQRLASHVQQQNDFCVYTLMLITTSREKQLQGWANYARSAQNYDDSGRGQRLRFVEESDLNGSSKTRANPVERPRQDLSEDY